MKTGITKSKARELALTSRFFVSVLTLFIGLTPQQALAATSNDQFHQYITDICNSTTFPAGWDMTSVFFMCSNTATGGPAGGQTPSAAVSANLGTANAGSGTATRKKKGIRVSLDEQKEEPAKGASADGGGWGLLAAPQYGKSDRPETELENGYRSELTGLIVGLDYRFSDNLVFGVAVGQTRDKADFLNNAGFLKSRSNTVTTYGTWLPTERFAVDGYLGYGKLNFDNQRQFDFGSNVSGTMSGSTTGRQVMAGLSASYQTNVDQTSLAPFVNLDYIKTTINGYNETGSNTNTDLMALRYSDRSVISFTSSLGARLSRAYGYDWGALVPSARLAAVHEFQNKTRQISNELVITPGTGFLVETDSPDRNYLNLGLGVVAALDSGAQLFIDYEKRTQDRLLSSWAVSVGALLEF